MNVSIRNARGFSLVELMVVVAIIGILAAIAVPNFQKFSAKSKQSEVKTSLSALYSALRAFHSEWQTYSSRFEPIGYAPVGILRYEHGFAADFHNMPANYSGPPGDAGRINTAGYCAVVANGCTVNQVPVAPGAVAGTAMTATTFTAQGRGDIDGDATVDIWTINEQKTITNTQDDLNL